MSELNTGSIVRTAILPLACLSFVFGIAGLSLAGADTEDLDDNETCAECHLDQEHIGLLKVEGKQVHNPADGSVEGEVHQEFACIDCHLDIEEIPHKEDVERTVDCLACHDETPK
ncbi:MAG TPA: hypothetical protein VJ984_08335 [Xanthomonadales bacterium]|nr:hypothetical protein [Xanthomonadales bacterium]